MGVTIAPPRPDAGCFPAGDLVNENIVHEGLLKYQSKNGTLKERWFLLDASTHSLVKCITSGRQRAYSLGSALGKRGEVLIADVSPVNVGNKTADAILSNTSSKSKREEGGSPTSPSRVIDEIFGFDVTTTQGTMLRFYTNNAEQQETWIQTIKKSSHGFTAGITEKMADRELLAGKYSLVRELGRGATGIVYLYTYRGRPYAIKKFTSQKAHKLPNRPRPGMPNKLGARPGMPGSPAAASVAPNGDSNAPSVPDDVRREIALLKKASHLPNLIRLHDVILDTEHSQYYLVMEFMGGGAIAGWDTEKKRYVVGGSNGSRTRHIRIVRNYVSNLFVGIKALHANRLCHRDIKPENLLADSERNSCRIADLGVAHYFKDDDGEVHEEEDDDVNVLEASINEETKSELNNSGGKIGMLRSTKGTYSFLPPEALSGGEFCGYKADIWACGITMYTLLYGQLPFYSPNIMELFDLIETKPLEFPIQNDLQQNEQQEYELAKDLIRKILEKDHEKRIGLDEILQHPWLHQGSNTKNLQEQLRAFSKAPSVSVQDHELDNAVSVLQSRFEIMSKALHENTPLSQENAPAASTNVSVSLKNIHDYKPRPIEVKDVVLPSWLEPNVDAIAAHLHYDWCRTKFMEGWKQGPERNDKDKIHPALLPMRDLSQEWKERNVTCVLETMKCILALGCQVKYQSKSKSRRLSLTRSISSSDEEMINMKTATMPLATDKVILSWEMMMLLDLLAENSHELWAQGYKNSGWSYGETYCTSARTHPSLKPYMALDEKDKNLSRDGIAAVLKSCICLGISISCSRRTLNP